jgi:hypothetical protein
LKWLEEENRSPREVDDLEADLNIGIAIDENEGLNVIFNKKAKDSVIVGAQVSFSELDVQAFSKLGNEKKRIFLEELTHSLLQLNVEHLVRPNGESMENVLITKVIYFDGLTKHKLFDTILLIRRGIRLVRWCYGKHLHPKPISGSPSFVML